MLDTELPISFQNDRDLVDDVISVDLEDAIDDLGDAMNGVVMADLDAIEVTLEMTRNSMTFFPK